MNLDDELDRWYEDPQDHEEIPVYMCAECKCGIMEGQEYWFIDGEYFCEDCAPQMFCHIAER